LPLQPQTGCQSTGHISGMTTHLPFEDEQELNSQNSTGKHSLFDEQGLPKASSIFPALCAKRNIANKTTPNKPSL